MKTGAHCVHVIFSKQHNYYASVDVVIAIVIFLLHITFIKQFRLYCITALFNFNYIIASEALKGMWKQFFSVDHNGIGLIAFELACLEICIECSCRVWKKHRAMEASVCSRRASLAPSFCHLKVIRIWFSFVLWWRAKWDDSGRKREIAARALFHRQRNSRRTSHEKWTLRKKWWDRKSSKWRERQLHSNHSQKN